MPKKILPNTAAEGEEIAVPGPYRKLEDVPRIQVLSQVLSEHDVFAKQRRRRKTLLKQIEDADAGRKCATIGFVSADKWGGGIDGDDITALGDVLMSVGDVDVLNLIINSPGGDGTVAEKIIELCRAYCKTFRVMIPNRAKSAATIIALGADEIVMGYCSEIGPIDAQIPIIVGGIPRYISAQSFIDARAGLQKAYQERLAQHKDARDLLTQLATLDQAFVDHCEKLMDFSKDVARSNLEKRMFRAVPPKRRGALIDKILTELAAPELFKVHGRMIDANSAKTRLKLNVRVLPKDDPLWQALWMYYVRADVFLSGRYGPPSSKLIESRHELLFMGAASLT